MAVVRASSGLTVCKPEYGPRGNCREKSVESLATRCAARAASQRCLALSRSLAGHAERALQYTTPDAMRLNITVNSKLVCMPRALRSCTPQLEHATPR